MNKEKCIVTLIRNDQREVTLTRTEKGMVILFSRYQGISLFIETDPDINNS